MKIILGDFNAQVARKNISKPKFGNESLHQDRNDNGVRREILAHQKIYLLRARCSYTETFISTPGPTIDLVIREACHVLSTT